jgi:hypothetical protein
MKSIKDEIVKKTHYKYNKYLQEQYIVDLDVEDKIKIQVLDKDNNLLDERIFTAKQINCHINCQWQDKGIKKEEVK